MSRLLLDTSGVIGCFERRDPTLISMIARADLAAAVSVITIGELERGVRNRADRGRLESLRAAQAMHRIDLDGVLGPSCFGVISSQVKRRIGALDCWIATSAVLGQYELVTQDQHLAEQLAGIDWSGTSWKPPTVTYVPVAG